MIALGGNAISPPQGPGSLEDQRRAIESACREIAQIMKGGARVVLTHGNGPQVGQLLIQQEHTRDLVPPLPLDVCVAMTQAQIGYLLQQALQSALKAQGLEIPIATVITQVIVDPNDPAFREPTKPIGPLYSQRKAEELRRSKGYVMRKVGNDPRAYRRVVPSPRPLKIVESGLIQGLLAAGHGVIACGGGGIPVIYRDGRLEGVEAVVDKDLASERLATALGASVLLILTDVERVALHYGTPEQVDLQRLSVEEAKRYLSQGEFPPGSMGPKIEAAINFLENGGQRAIIASLDQAQQALEGKAGTQITVTGEVRTRS